MDVAGDPSLPYKRMEERDLAARRMFDGLLTAFQPTVVCDIGAFNGDETSRFASLVPSARVCAFEASEDNINSFWRGNPAWGLTPNVTWEHMAVTNHTGTVTFNILDAEDTAADWRRAANSLLDRSEGLPQRKVEVAATRLDDYFPDPSRDLFALWIDVEGALEQVLSGATAVLERTVLLRAEVERKAFWENQLLAEDIKADLESRGFVCLGDTHVANAYDQSDILYVRGQLLDLVSPPSLG